MTSSIAVFEAATQIQPYYVYVKIMIEKPEKKEKIFKSKKCLHQSRPNRRFRNGIHSLLSRADAGESADIVYCM